MSDPSVSRVPALRLNFRLGVDAAAENRAALQRAIDAGAGEIVVGGQGVFDLFGPVVLRSGTHLRFEKGVYVRRQAEPGVIANSLFINAGAMSDAWDEDIALDGLFLIANGVDPQWSKPVLRQGICSQVSFFHVKDLVVRGYTCLDLPEQGFGVQICSFENLLVEDVHIEGKKDGVHLGPGRAFVIRNGIFRTYDDPIALNAFDYAISNPEVGWIEDGLVENCVDLDQPTTEGFFCRFPIGSWCEWFPGMEVRCSTAVLHGGRLYRVIMPPDGKTYTSQTCPTHESGYVTLDGITWYMMQKTDGTDAAVRDVTFRNIRLCKRRRVGFAITTEDHEWHRAIYPGTKPPFCERIRIENLSVEVTVGELVGCQAPGDVTLET